MYLFCFHFSLLASGPLRGTSLLSHLHTGETPLWSTWGSNLFCAQVGQMGIPGMEKHGVIHGYRHLTQDALRWAGLSRFTENLGDLTCGSNTWDLKWVFEIPGDEFGTKFLAALKAEIHKNQWAPDFFLKTKIFGICAPQGIKEQLLSLLEEDFNFCNAFGRPHLNICSLSKHLLPDALQEKAVLGCSWRIYPCQGILATRNHPQGWNRWMKGAPWRAGGAPSAALQLEADVIPRNSQVASMSEERHEAPLFSLVTFPVRIQWGIKTRMFISVVGLDDPRGSFPT